MYGFNSNYGYEQFTIRDIVEISGMTQTDFARHYNIPLRTLQSWLGDPELHSSRTCPPYTQDFLLKAVLGMSY